MLTSFLSDLFGQLSFGPRVSRSGHSSPQFIFKVLSLEKSFNSDSKELVPRLRVLYNFLDKKGSWGQEER
jgi:hypothetical protein